MARKSKAFLRRSAAARAGWETRRKNAEFARRSAAAKKGVETRRRNAAKKVKDSVTVLPADRAAVRAAFERYLQGNEALDLQFSKLKGKELREYADAQMARVRAGTGFKPGDYLVVMRYAGGATETTPKAFGLEFIVNSITGQVRRTYTPADHQRERDRSRLHKWGQRAHVVKTPQGFRIQ